MVDLFREEEVNYNGKLYDVFNVTRDVLTQPKKVTTSKSLNGIKISFRAPKCTTQQNLLYKYSFLCMSLCLKLGSVVMSLTYSLVTLLK